ncbi:MAG TPA: hypothetical protein VLG10_14155 [Methylomirabilota bacterium]|nr:hypothetical protein [Methylomirabilota bacterium]
MMSDVIASPMLLAVLWSIVIWVGGAILTGWAAVQNNRSGAMWFVIALVLSPLLALLALAVIPQGE